MVLRVLLTLGRLVAIAGVFGIMYVAATAAHFSPTAYVVAIFVWLMVFGGLFGPKRS
jgi:uncharacterized membrane protein